MPFLTRFLLFASIALILGLGTTWRAVSGGFFATTARHGPWTFWLREGTGDADPYTAAHTAREGSLPLTSASAMTFTATRDSAGSRLIGDCTYEVKGYAIPALWWNLAAFRKNGETMPNKTGRSSFTSANILAAPDGAFVVRLSPDVQPGNWLPSERGERVALRMTVLRPLAPDVLLNAGRHVLPSIKLMECS